MSLGSPGGKLFPRLLYQPTFAGEISKPQSVDARASGVENARIEQRRLACGCPVHDDPSEVAKTANAFRDVLSAEHFEDDIYAFAVRHLLDSVFVIALLIIDAMLQSELFHARQLLVRRRCSIHLDAEQLSHLDSSRTDAASHGMDQHPWCSALASRDAAARLLLTSSNQS